MEGSRGLTRVREKAPLPDPMAADAPVLTVESLDHEGRGVGHADGKVIFIDGALAGERVSYASRRKKASYEIADVGRIESASTARVVPRCPHFGVCGGCSMQHLDAGAQVAVKQRVLEDNLWHLGRVRAGRMLPPIHGPTWGYRHRARLSVRLVEKKGGVLVGFHERRSSYVADMRECHVVPPHVSALLVPLRALVGSLSIARRLPQIELAIGEGATLGARGPASGSTALGFDAGSLGKAKRPATPPTARQARHKNSQTKKPEVNSGRRPYAAGSRDGASSAGSGAALIAGQNWTMPALGAIGTRRSMKPGPRSVQTSNASSADSFGALALTTAARPARASERAICRERQNAVSCGARCAFRNAASALPALAECTSTPSTSGSRATNAAEGLSSTVS